jgi:hypothetical protein
MLKHIRMPQLLWIVALTFFMLCAAYVIYAGIVRAGSARWIDGTVFYVVGKCLASGNSPYNGAQYTSQRERERLPEYVQPDTGGGCPYPLSVAFVAFPMALFRWQVARRILDAANVAAFAALCFFCMDLARRTRLKGWRDPALYVFAGLSCLVSALPGTLYVGQVGLIALAGGIGACWAWMRGIPLLAACFVILGSVKPQIAFLPLFYLLVTGAHVPVISGGVVVAGASLLGLAFLPGPIGDTLADMQRSYAAYRTGLPYNSLENYSSIAAVLGKIDSGEIIMRACAAAGCLGAAALACAARRGRQSVESQAPSTVKYPFASPVWHLILISVCSAAFMPLHPYDLVVFCPAITLLAIARNQWAAGAVAAAIITASRSGLMERYTGFAPRFLLN